MDTAIIRATESRNPTSTLAGWAPGAETCDLVDTDADLAQLSGACGDFADSSGTIGTTPAACDWASLCDDARHSVGAAEVLQLNERCDGIEDALPGAMPLESTELNLAISRFSGPRPACVVTERYVVTPESGERSTPVAQAILRCGLAVAQQIIGSHEAAIRATVRAGRRSAGQAIGVVLTCRFATRPDISH